MFMTSPIEAPQIIQIQGKKISAEEIDKLIYKFSQYIIDTQIDLAISTIKMITKIPNAYYLYSITKTAFKKDNQHIIKMLKTFIDISYNQDNNYFVICNTKFVDEQNKSTDGRANWN